MNDFYFMQKRPSFVCIDTSALADNVKCIQQHLQQQGLCAVIKSNAYGHGMLQIANILQQQGVNYLAVFWLEEAIQLRQAGIKGSIYLLGCDYNDDPSLLWQYRITPMVGRLYQLALLQEEAKKHSHLPAFAIHLEIDTGINRSGLSFDEYASALKQLQQSPNLRLTGLMSHFSTADRPSDPVNAQQKALFEKAIHICKEHGMQPGICHLANSAAVLADPLSNAHLARVGILLYGISPEILLPSLPLKAVLSWHSRVIALRTIDAGESVSYHHSFTAKRRTRVATLAVGYADGYKKALSNRFHVLIHGQKAAIIGNICMDVLMVDATDIHEIHIGSPVTLLGSDGQQRITVEAMADSAGSIAHDILCSIHPLLKRHYLESSCSPNAGC